MRICVVYDCLFPYTVGGAERWYRNLAERLAADGHEVTYLTLRQWERGERPDAGAGVRVVARRAADGAVHRRAAAGGSCRRCVFGAGVLVAPARHGRRYDVVHTCLVPLLLAARGGGGAAARRAIELVVDWFEVWSAPTGASTSAAPAGASASSCSALCARVRQRAFCFSRLHAARLREEGLRGEVTVLRGLYVDDGALRSRPRPTPSRRARSCCSPGA